MRRQGSNAVFAMRLSLAARVEALDEHDLLGRHVLHIVERVLLVGAD